MSVHRKLLGAAVTASILAAAAVATTSIGGASAATGSTPAVQRVNAASTALPPIGHVFVINLENKGYDETFGPGSAAPYLSRTLRGKGNLLTQYYGTAHLSLPNYIGQISGKGPDSQTQSDCQNYSDFVGSGAATVPPQQVVGNGCVYPKSVRTLPNQLAGKGLT
ncbi:MAG: hypothetical protein WCB04_10960, partial [Mycobacteriales bacterium]